MNLTQEDYEKVVQEVIKALNVHIPPTDHEVISAMNRHGGLFMKKLAEAAFHANTNNLAIIKAGFATAWEDYGLLALNDRKKDHAKNPN